MSGYTMKLIKVALIAVTALWVYPATAHADDPPQVFRNSDAYNLSLPGGGYALLVVSSGTPNEPVYSWRTHVRVTGPGELGYDGELIGHTNQNGNLVIAVTVPNDPIFCGLFENETFAVGSPNAPRSAPIAFQIFRGVDFSPRDPDCVKY